MMPRFEPSKEQNLRIPYFYVDKFKNLLESHGKEKAELIWEDKFKDFRDEHQKLVHHRQQTLVAPGQMDKHFEKDYLLKESDLIEFYLSSFFTILPLSEEPNEYSIIRSIQNDSHQRSIEDSDKLYNELFRYRITNSLAINLTNFSFHSLFNRLKLNDIVRLFRYVLMEKQLVIFSTNPRDIVYLCEALFSFINPM